MSLAQIGWGVVSVIYAHYDLRARTQVLAVWLYVPANYSTTACVCKGQTNTSDWVQPLCVSAMTVTLTSMNNPKTLGLLYYEMGI